MKVACRPLRTFIEFFYCIPIKLKYSNAGLLALRQSIVVLAKGESSGCVRGDRILVDAFENKCQTGLCLLAAILIWIQNELAVFIDDAMYAG